MLTAVAIFGSVAASNWLGSYLMHEKVVCCEPKWLIRPDQGHWPISL